jgi:hypothetical protein
LLGLNGLKIIKIIFGVITALWALALVPQLVDAISNIAKPHAFANAAGSVFGMLLASTLSVLLFRKAFPQTIPPRNYHAKPTKLSRSYNLVLPLIALTGLAFEASSVHEPLSWATLCVMAGMSDARVVQVFVIIVWLAVVVFGLATLFHAMVVIAAPLRNRLQPRWLSHVAFFLCLAHFFGSAAITQSKNFQRNYQLFSSR